MNHALLIAQRFDKRDGRLLRIRTAMREAGFTVTSIAFDSGGEAQRDPETRDLRPRAIGALMLASQLVIAIVIAGYFARFYPLAMTVVFWTVILTGILLANPMGESLRRPILARLSDRLGQFETSKKQFDVIWAVDPESLRLAARLAKRDGAKLIFDTHEFHREEAPDDDARRQWAIREESRAAASIDQWVAVNSGIAALYAAEFENCDPIIISNAVDAKALDKASSPLRTAIDAGPDTRILLYHGQMRSMRHLPDLVSAAHLLPENWKVVLLGDGAMKAELEASGSPAIFLDAIAYEALPAWIAGADLGAILYEPSGLNQQAASPNKLYEFIAYGVPILTSNLPELRHFASGKACGYVIDSDITAKSIADAVGSISPADLEKMRAATREVAETLSWQSEKSKVMSILPEIKAAALPR